jgi:prepilin-type N-terminal cleavage/methylation domain-containing protein
MMQAWISRCSFRRKKTGSRGETTIGNRGFSFVELMIAIAVLSVVSVMLIQILTSATSLYRKTLFTSQLQKSSQMISRRLETAIMNAKSLYYQTDGDNAFLYMGGDRQEGTDSDDQEQKNASYRGSLLWFDAAAKSIYYCDAADVTVSSGQKLTAEDVKKALEGDDSASKEYLLSTNVSALTFELPSEMQVNKTGSDGTICTYSTDRQPSITYHLTLQHTSGITYAISNTAVPRNRLKEIWWQNRATESTQTSPDYVEGGEITDES